MPANRGVPSPSTCSLLVDVPGDALGERPLRPGDDAQVEVAQPELDQVNGHRLAEMTQRRHRGDIDEARIGIEPRMADDMIEAPIGQNHSLFALNEGFGTLRPRTFGLIVDDISQ